MTKRKAQAYDESNIRVLKGLEAVRKKPGMYMGERGDQMIWRIHKELVDNSIDEAYAGRNDTVEQYLDVKNNHYIVADFAQGIPVGTNKSTGKSTLDVVFTELHAGGKFDAKAYKNSAGTHGVGAACSNALSSDFRVWTNREGKWYFRHYKEGAPIGKLKSVKSPDKDVMALLQSKSAKYGTIISYTPDQTITSIDATNKRVKKKADAKLPMKQALQWSRMIALMNPGLCMVVNYKGAKKPYKFLNKGDISAVVKKLVKDNDLSTVVKPLVVQTETVDLTMQWTSHDETDLFRSYVNCSPTKDNGKHYDGFTAALGRVLQSYKSEVVGASKKGKEQTFKTTDALYGLVGIINFKMSEPEFSSQTKDRLVSHVNKDCEETLVPLIRDYFDKNKTLAKTVIKRALAISKGRDELKKVMKSVADVRKNSRGMMLPNILCSADKAKPHERELTIVEGDSAGGCHFFSTKVQLINGVQKNFKQLVKDHEKGIVNYTYAHNNATGKIHVVPVEEPRIVKHTKYLTKVTLDNGEVLKCTRNHPWKLRTGEYIAAEDLEPGDSLMPHIERIRTQGEEGEIGRREIRHPMWSPKGNPTSRGMWEPVYKLVVRNDKRLRKAVKAIRSEGLIHNTHHVDFDKLNDHPNNLVIMEQGKHRTLHAKLTSAYAGFQEGEANVHARLMKTDAKYRKRMTRIAEKHFKGYWGDEENRAAQSERTRAHMESDQGTITKKAISNSVKEYRTEEKKEEQSVRASRQQNKPSVKNKRIQTLLARKFHQYMNTMNSLQDVSDEYAFNVEVHNRKEAGVKNVIKDFEYWTFFYTSYESFLEELENYDKETSVPSYITEGEQDAGRNKQKLNYDTRFWRQYMDFIVSLPKLSPKAFAEYAYKLSKKGEAKRIPYSFDTWCRYYETAKEFKQALVDYCDLSPTPEKLIANHAVVSVENITMKEEVPVYDFSVSKLHNYALGAGVYVHNTAKHARDSTFQEVFKLRGKLTNSSRTDMASLLKSQVIQNLLIALGVDLKSIDLDAESLSDMTFATDNLRVGNIMILCDADTDGSHIAVLLLSAFMRLLPKLYTEGRIYIVLSPLFLAQHRDVLYSGMTLKEVQNKLPANANAPITRAKGLGELNADVLRDVAFDVKNRHLIKVIPPRDGDMQAYFYAITGSNSSARKELLGLS